MSDWADEGFRAAEGAPDFEALLNALQRLKWQGRETIVIYGREQSIDDAISAILRWNTFSYDDDHVADSSRGSRYSPSGAERDEGFGPLDTIADPKQQAELEAVETRMYVETYLPLLNSDQETVIRLHYGIGGQPPMELEEIAEELFMGIYYVKWNLKQGLGYLKSFMQHDADFETDPVDGRTH